MNNNTNPNNLSFSELHDKAEMYRSQVLEGSLEFTDYPEIESAHAAGGAYPGLPNFGAPEDGDWRTKSVTLLDEDRLLVVEECIGYEDKFTNVEEDGTHVVVNYYVSVKPGYRATRLRKVSVEDIPYANGDEEDNIIARSKKK